MDRLRDFFSHTFGYKRAHNSSSSSSLNVDVESRTISFNIPLTEHKFARNSISTGKYNFLTFLPLFLFGQFRKAFNLFFLFICIIQQIPGVSPTGRFTTLVPLLLILLVAAIKEILEDYKRHRQDDVVNNRLVDVFREGRFFEIRWKEVVVGDIVRIVNGKFFPADLVLLSSSEPQAMCYIETANLDGETNLKIRQGLPLTSELISSEDLASMRGEIECEGPNRHLYEFNGNISLRDFNERCVPLCNDQMLLRGAMLRNTQWVYGVVVYTGHQSKLMMNANRPPLKMSNVDKTTNLQIWFIFVILITISLGSAIGSVIWKNASTNKWYIRDTGELKYRNGRFFIVKFYTDRWLRVVCCLAVDFAQGPGARGFFLELLTFIILYNNLVPISLLVTLEMVKFVQAIFINCDIDMYYEKNDTPAIARTSNLNEELGQVKYIFSDKTGTLTQNQMVFKKCSVAGLRYGDGDTGRKGFYDEDFTNKLHDNNDKNKPVRDFATMMAVCHTVVPEYVRSTNSHLTSSNRVGFHSSRDIEYQSSSPDETALVEAARELGYVFTERTPSHVTINKLGEEETYEILNVLDFTSSRKRMSVIVRSPDGAILLFCKGADNVIFERLADTSHYTYETETDLKDFARDGLRTLCFAYAKLDENFYNVNIFTTTLPSMYYYDVLLQNWSSTVFHSASTALTGREEALALAYEQVETNLQLMGATAIEDRLQDGVPHTIATLMSAGIKVWVLTGDKQETAVNIAHSCRLFTDQMKLIFLDQSSLDETRKAILEALDDIGIDYVRQENDLALVVSGTALKQATSFDNLTSFLDLALSCKSVVCCRVSPIQKAEVVSLIKTHCKAITLAIGDGANDVSMIQVAHVGVGISGCEGLQAANSSDYSIAQFSYLQKLLLVHGSWNFTRLTKCILFSFYKNICLYLIELWFAFFNGFSGQILFDRWAIALYNVFFTSLPPLTLGIFERTCSSEYMLKYPKLYSLSQEAIKYNATVFWKMFLNASVHSLLIYFLTALALPHGAVFSTGQTGGYLFLGNFVYTYVVVTVCMKAGLDSNTWTVFTHIALWGSIATWFLFLIVYSYFFPALPVGEDMVRMGNNMFSSAFFWLGLILIPVTVLSRDLLWKIIRRKFMKSIVEEVHELEMKDIDPSTTINAAMNRQSVNERSGLLKYSRERVDSRTIMMTSCENRDRSASHNSGYAFSQEEGGVVSQSQLIRQYDSHVVKPDGS